MTAWRHGPLTRYVKFQVAHAPGMPGTFSPRRQFQRKPLFSYPGMHHGTCVTHVPWCMSGSLTCGDGENIPGIPGACAPAILRIWQEAHVAIQIWATLDSGKSRLCDGTTPLPEPALTNRQWGHVAFTWGQFHKKCSRFLYLMWVWRLLF